MKNKKRKMSRKRKHKRKVRGRLRGGDLKHALTGALIAGAGFYGASKLGGKYQAVKAAKKAAEAAATKKIMSEALAEHLKKNN